MKRILALFTLMATSLTAAPFLWMLDDSSTLYVLDTATNTLVQTITGFSDPEGLVFTPDGAYCYVICEGTNTVKVYDTSDYSLVTTIPEMGSPYSFDGPYFGAASPDGATIYVASYDSGTVNVISTATNQIVDQIPYTVGPMDGPYPLAVSPNGEYLYVGNYSSDNVTIINTSTNTAATGNISLAGDAAWITFAPNGTAYVVDYTNTVTVISPDFSSTSFTSTYVGEPYFIAVTPNGNTAYLATYSPGSVAFFNTANPSGSIATVSDPDSYISGADSLAISPNGQTVYVPHGSSLTLISTSDNVAYTQISPAGITTSLDFIAFQPAPGETPRAFRRPTNRR